MFFRFSPKKNAEKVYHNNLDINEADYHNSRMEVSCCCLKCGIYSREREKDENIVMKRVSDDVSIPIESELERVADIVQKFEDICSHYELTIAESYDDFDF